MEYFLTKLKMKYLIKLMMFGGDRLPEFNLKTDMIGRKFNYYTMKREIRITSNYFL